MKCLSHLFFVPLLKLKTKITPFCVFVMAKTARDIMSLQSVSECVVVEIRALLRAPNDKELAELTLC